MAKQPFKQLNRAGVGSVRSSRPGWSKAFALLRFELAKIGATEVVIEAGYQNHQIRNDGYPLSSARPEHGQVRISFRKGNVPISFIQTGMAEVESNVWLIARTLNALRAVDRYGCTQGGEQYKGWAQLPPGTGSNGTIHAAEWPSVEAAMRYLCSVGNGDVLSVLPKDLDVVYRAAARKAHPDAGGSTATMAKVNRAKDFIEQHH